MSCRLRHSAALVASAFGFTGVYAQAGFWPANELVPVEPPPGAVPVNAGQVILGKATRYVMKLPASSGRPFERIGVTADFVQVRELAQPEGGVNAELKAVSDDGERVLGRVSFLNGDSRACLWDGDGPARVSAVGSADIQVPVGMSDDGERWVIKVGASGSAQSFVVSEAAAIEIVVNPDESPALETVATAVSPDGLTVCGVYNGGGEAFMWNAAGGAVVVDRSAPVAPYASLVADQGRRVVYGAVVIQNMGLATRTYARGRWRVIPGFRAAVMSRDASLLLGSFTAGGQAAAVWSETTGVSDLRAVLTARGGDVRGWTLTGVDYVSADGGRIVGRGTAPGSGVSRWWVAAVEPFAAADVARQGGVDGSDGRLDNNDLIVYIDRFFARDERADVGSVGAERGGDGSFDNNDFCVFIELFFGGQP